MKYRVGKFKHQQFENGRSTVRIVPLGGAGNVTKNMYVYEHRYDGAIRDILIVDCGIGFPEPEMYGVDLVIPDIRYLSDKSKYIRGIVFTHGHDDHIGGIPYIYPKLPNVPLYGTTLTAAFANIKLKEARIPQRVKEIPFGQTITLGVFSVTFIRVTHSVPDTAHLLVNTPIGNIYHGSDFKFDMTPLDGKTAQIDAINAAGRKGVKLMLTDCLGSERYGFTPSEQKIGDSIEKELKLCQGRFFFTTQSSNISLIQMAIDIAIKFGRRVALLGRSIDQNVEASVKLRYMNIPREYIVTDRDLKRLPREKQCIIIAGSQGQPESALSRAANDSHQRVKIDDGDTVLISADPIPGNEINVSTLIDQLYRRGARVSYTNIMDDLHVTGHGNQGDLMFLASMVGPKYILPIGGTFRHMMQYRRLAVEIGYQKNQVLILDEGQVIEMDMFSKPKVVETLKLENIMVDGFGVGDVGNIVLRDRQTIAKEGIMVIFVPMEKSSNRITASPDVITRGFVYVRESGKLLDETKRIVLNALKVKKGRIVNWQYLRKQVEDEVGEYLYKATGRSPLIVPVIVEV